MQRDGSTRHSVLIILVTAAVLAIVVFAFKHGLDSRREETEKKMREEARESQKKMRQVHEEGNKDVIAALKKGNAFVSGIRFSDGGGMESASVTGLQKGEQTTCSIPWSVPSADFARIAEGMTLEEVRVILDLSALNYIPNEPQCRFVLECNRPKRKVTLVFAGNPEVKLVSKSSEGSD